MAQAEARAPNAEEWDIARGFLHDAAEPRLPFSGTDLTARGVTEGPAIGDALRRLEGLWISAGFPDDPQRLAELLDDAVAQSKRSIAQGDAG
ncbi:hypothetical protein RZS28_02415 [Methylocapsa polymorpha]|uniref:Uncharacterized protein n=1 Tax=Methylocapsa polymorpha TaxID=3080828 RepID=A0ABZ0HSJ0_9HYPH|nr:hypothetical protein RZS28_02415 [Methylocapsa sp. RX1]